MTDLTSNQRMESGDSYKSATSAMIAAAQPKWTRLPIRTRPHRNPLAENDDEHTSCPDEFSTKIPLMYPAMPNKHVEFLDVGCAFGGMLFDLCAIFPSTLMLGLEIRGKVVEFAQGKAVELRQAAKEGNAEGQSYHHFNNVWFDQLNVMKFGSNCFAPGQLKKIFFCYPDPHWKRKNIRRRIISPGLVQEYAHLLEVGGLIYTVSDVPELEDWMIKCLDDSPLFVRLTEKEIDEYSENHRKVVDIVTSSSEDAIRTQRKGLNRNYAVHKRILPQYV